MYGSQRLGIEHLHELLKDNDLPRDRTAGLKEYELTNHLGNVLATISDIRQVDASNLPFADVLTAQDYYPFGMQMPERQYAASSNGYRFSFNGKEKDDEVKGSGNEIDMGARFLDPRLGRTSSVDPKAHEYPGISPYAFALNTQITAIDADGKPS